MPWILQVRSKYLQSTAFVMFRVIGAMGIAKEIKTRSP